MIRQLVFMGVALLVAEGMACTFSETPQSSKATPQPATALDDPMATVNQIPAPTTTLEPATESPQILGGSQAATVNPVPDTPGTYARLELLYTPPAGEGVIGMSPNGKSVAIGSSGRDVSLLDVTTGQRVDDILRHEITFHSIAFSPDGEILAVGASVGVILWDVSTGERLKTLAGHDESVQILAFSPDGEILASGGFLNKTIKLWNTSSGELLGNVPDVHDLTFAAFTPDSKNLVYTTHGADTRLWDIESAEVSARFPSDVYFLSEPNSPDNPVVVSIDNAWVRLWDASSGEMIRGFHVGERTRTTKFSLDGETLATASGQTKPEVKLWGITSGELRKTIPFQITKSRPTHSMAFSPDLNLLAVAAGFAIQLWDANTGKLLQEESWSSEGQVQSLVAFSPDGSILLTGGGKIRLWGVQAQRSTVLEGDVTIPVEVAENLEQRAPTPTPKPILPLFTAETLTDWSGGHGQCGTYGVCMFGHSMAVAPSFSSDQTIFVGTEEDGVFRYSKGGGFASLNRGLPSEESFVYAIGISPAYENDGTVFIGVKGHGIYRSRNKGESWEKILALGDWRWLHLEFSPGFARDNIVFASSSGGLYKSVDGGDSWQRNPRFGSTPYLALSPDFETDNTLFMGGYRSEDGGESFESFMEPQGLIRGTTHSGVAFSPNFSQDGIVFAGKLPYFEEPMGIYRSSDRGESWEFVPGDIPFTQEPFSPTGIDQIEFSPTFSNDRTVFAFSSTGRLISKQRISSVGAWVSKDAGKTWSPFGTTDLSSLQTFYGTQFTIRKSPDFERDRTFITMHRTSGLFLVVLDQ